MPKSKRDVKADFEARGETLRDWAEKRNYKPSLVYAVMHGRIKGKRGKAHLIAVELGLKDAPDGSSFL